MTPAPFHELADRRLARFAIVGLSNTVLGLSLIFGAKAMLGFGDAAANVTGYAVVVTLSFMLNRQWTFEDGGNAAASLLRFLLVLAAAYLANLATVVAAIELLGVNGYLAHVLGVFPYAATGYLGSRLFVFTAPRPARAAQH